jgi:purine-binding chemotaxis protein CheW
MTEEKDRRIDWALVRKRADALLRMSEQAGKPSWRRARELLEERARILARPVREEADGRTDMVLFDLAGRRCAIESRYVYEVVARPRLTPVPRTAAFVAGIANIRGELLPAFDLAKVLDPAATASTAPMHMMVLGKDDPELGILVEKLPKTDQLPEAELAPAGAPPASPTWLHRSRQDLFIIGGSELFADPRFFIEMV